MRYTCTATVLALSCAGFLNFAFAGPLDDELSKARSLHRASNYAAELQILRPLAEQGNAAAQKALGSLYVSGDGVVQDYVEAVKWFRMAAEQGFADAQDDLARMYVQGQ